MRLSSLFLAGAALLAAPLAAQAEGTLTVYTYDSFTSEWGPGPQVERPSRRNAAAT